MRKERPGPLGPAFSFCICRLDGVSRLGGWEYNTPNPAEDLMLAPEVRITGLPEQLEDWRGREGDSFTVDLGAPRTLGGVTFLWGTGVGALRLEPGLRQPEKDRFPWGEAVFWYAEKDQTEVSLTTVSPQPSAVKRRVISPGWSVLRTAAITWPS